MTEGQRRANTIRGYLCVILLGIGILFVGRTVRAAEDPNSCWSNFSNVSTPDRYGCPGQNVFDKRTFYCNFWNPNGNLQLRSATVTIKKNGVRVAGDTVWSADSSHYFNYATFPFKLDAGTYTVERSITRLNGESSSWDSYTLTVYPASKGFSTSVSATNISLYMTGTKSQTVKFTFDGILPESYTIRYDCSNSNVTGSWGGWEGPGWYDSTPGDTHNFADRMQRSDTLTLTGVTGGSTTVTVTLRSPDTNEIYATKTLNVTVGPNYTVSYNANGGSGTPGSQTKYYGKTLALSSTKPTRTGYDFLGWSTSSTATSASYSSGGSYTSNSSVTLYAVWKPWEYKIYYYANGGSGAPGTQTKYYGQTLYLSSTKPTRTGYDFLGWSTSSSATYASWLSGESYTSNSGMSLYAVWKPWEYKIYYNANGGSGAPGTQTKYYGQTLYLSSTKPTRTGYIFLGWATSSTAASASYASGGSYTSNESVTLYAVWEEFPFLGIIEYEVTYNANGGSGAPEMQTKYLKQTLYLSGTKPARTGYAFLGWSTDSQATSATYLPGDICTYSFGDATFGRLQTLRLYAVWKPYEYQVTYNANGGSGAPGTQIKYYGQTLYLSSTKPERAGYEFLGWSTSSAATSASYASGGSYTSNAAITLYAVWKKQPDNSGTGNGSTGGGSTGNGSTNSSGSTGTGGTSGSGSTGTGGTSGSGSTGTGGTNGSGSTGTGGTSGSGSTGTGSTGGSDSAGNGSSTGGGSTSSGNTGSNTVTKPNSVKQTIQVKKSITKAYKKNATFKLGAKAKGKLTYKSANKKIVTVSKHGTVKIKDYGKTQIIVNAAAKGKYKKASVKVEINIVPKSIAGFKAKSVKAKTIKVSWKRSKEVTGYQLQCSRNKKFPKKGRIDAETKKNKSTSATIYVKKQDAGKYCYVRLRGYKMVRGKKIYTNWSKVQKVKVKK